MNYSTSSSDKIKTVDQKTFHQMCQKLQTKPKTYKKCRKIANLSEFLNLKSHYKKQKHASFAIYKIKRKSVRKCKSKKKSKLKKSILKYRSLKPSQATTKTVVTPNEVKEENTDEVVIDGFESLTIKEILPAEKKKAVHSRRFREYCDNTTSVELDNLVDTLLRKLNHFQRRAFKLNNLKANSRRRIVVGFREVQVWLEVKKLKCVIIATDCEKCDFEDGLDSVILEIREECQKSDIPCVFALQRRKLSYVLHQKCPASCVGILDYDGAQEIFSQLIDSLQVEKSNYARLFRKEIK